MTNQKICDGDFVMFRKHNSQWGCNPYRYGMILKTYHYGDPHTHPDNRKLRCDIYCTDGKKSEGEREDRIIVLANGKKGLDKE